MLTAKSVAKLRGVHPLLVKVVEAAVPLCNHAGLDIQITEGLRDKERQQLLVNTGKSRTMNSRHLTGHAVDICIYENNTLTWNFKSYQRAAKLFQRAADQLGVEIVWGGDWDSDGRSDDERLVDGPHFELNRSVYP